MTRAVRHLLAKSCNDPEHPPGEATLRGHTMLVCEAADRLLGLRGQDALCATGLEPTWSDRLHRIVRVAAFAHDLGKCSEHFQSMIRGKRRTPQLVRHEALSLWLMWPGQPLSSWLGAGLDRWDLMIAAVASAGHHRKFWQRAIAPLDSGAGTEMELFTDHPEFYELLEAGARRLELGELPALTRARVEVSRRRSIVQALEDWETEWREYARDRPRDQKLAAVAKAFVLAADVAGSALPRSEKRLTWIDEQLAQRATADDLHAVVDSRLAGRAPRPFQLAVAASSAPITFVRAGCGSGKTVAAYMWAAQQQPGRQLWVTYPTTGTTTEGFRDYVADVDLVARLEHSRREIDMEIFDLGDESEGSRARDRLDALRAWGCEAIVCTVDTVLGLVQNQRKGLYAWPGLAHAAVVFDEIHAYDDALFGALLRFLEAMPGTPALLMTASLPADRMTALRGLVGRLHNATLAEIEGPPELERLPRYVRVDAEPLAAAQEVLDSGGKVLWVSNTVGRCISIVDRMPAALIYHSRFRYIDRVQCHAAVIAAFGRAAACIATTTQVAEMSLDLSADLLITDLAPIPALIQRLGRLNRRATPEQPGTPRPFIVLPVGGRAKPYSTQQLDEASDWLQRLGPAPLSQADLVAAWTSNTAAPPARVVSAWLDGGFATVAAPLREASIGLTVLREEDAASVRADQRLAAKLSIPMSAPPRQQDWRCWPEVAFLPVAPTAALSYDPQRGGTWS